MKIVDKIIKIKSDTLLPRADFIEGKIKEYKIEPVRWAIIDVSENELTLSVAGIAD